MTDTRPGQAFWLADARIERMRRLREEDHLSTREVAAAIGTTKNAVVGKLNRLGMLNNAPVETMTQRLDALHDEMDRVLRETNA